MSADEARTRAMGLQKRICTTEYTLPANAREVFKELKKGLLAGFHCERIRTPPAEISRMLQLERSGKRAWAIVGGDKDFDRISSENQFERCDDALFNFSITLGIRSSGAALELLAYDFELRFPAHSVEQYRTPFVRFDLNMPGHQNSDKGMRCHLHPGHDDLQAPSALMTPVELLELFVHGLALPARPRAQ